MPRWNINIDLLRVVPEEAKPKRISINNRQPVIEG